jgi:hypothetical protein
LRYRLPVFVNPAADFAVCETENYLWATGVKAVQIKICLSYEMHVGNFKSGGKQVYLIYCDRRKTLDVNLIEW